MPAFHQAKFGNGKLTNRMALFVKKRSRGKCRLRCKQTAKERAGALRAAQRRYCRKNPHIIALASGPISLW